VCLYIHTFRTRVYKRYTVKKGYVRIHKHGVFESTIYFGLSRTFRRVASAGACVSACIKRCLGAC